MFIICCNKTIILADFEDFCLYELQFHLFQPPTIIKKTPSKMDKNNFFICKSLFISTKDILINFKI